jgi:phosphoglycerol transferase MdoB-like AlkP superfamily enzyme
MRIGGLPEHNTAGRFDDYALTYFLTGTLLLTFLLGRAGKYLFISILSLVVTFLISNWWYFSFYRDYISVDTLKLFLYAKENAMNLSGLPHKDSAFLLVSVMVVLSALLFSISKLKPKPTYIIIISILLLGTGGLKEYKFLEYELGGGVHKGSNPVNYLIRDIFSREKPFVMTSEHLHSLKALYPNKEIAKHSENYPLQTTISNTPKAKQKNVIIVVMESMRAAEMGVYSNIVSQSVSPNLDQISKETVFFKNAYANSFQTIRSEFAILCSAFDYTRGSPFSEANKDIPTNCLPNILKNNGYKTHWIHGYKKAFFNRSNFMPMLGFDEVHDQSSLNDAGYNKVLGWGVPDTDVFDYALENLERQTQPFFAEVLTLSNHFPYTWDWPISFPDPITQKPNEEQSNYNNYKRGMYYTDYAVGEFWAKFKQSPLYDNTIVIFTGDHGIWLFDEELTNREDKVATFIKKEQYFRVPLMLYSPEISEPYTDDQVVSQVDIAPTLVNLLGISADTAFWGRDITIPRSITSQDSMALFIGNGHRNFRRGEYYCHPTESASKKDSKCAITAADQQCNFKLNNDSSYECAHTEQDMLSSKNLNIKLIDSLDDSAHVKRAMEYSKHGLNHGLIQRSN